MAEASPPPGRRSLERLNGLRSSAGRIGSESRPCRRASILSWVLSKLEVSDAAAGPADVTEQRLQHPRRSDDLDADRVLRPADGVSNIRCPVTAGIIPDSEVEY